MSFGIDVDQIELLSVGIDVGSSTSHLVFSELTLERDETSPSLRFQVAKRNIMYSSPIIDTPLIDSQTIDIPAVVKFFKDQYATANINPEDVQSGVVIVTGETAKKQNAHEIVNLLAEDAGTFVAATAGPNFESVIAAFGSGATTYSQDSGKAVISCDVGGGTSNIAVSVDGNVVSTSCISVGGRLIGFSQDFIINRIDSPAQQILDDLEMNYTLGDKMSVEDITKVCEALTAALFEALQGSTQSELGKALMMTSDIELTSTEYIYSFSGGVAEMIYSQESQDYNDIGYFLGQAIKARAESLGLKIYEPENKIRATVIGAGCYTLQVSGSTSFLDDDTIAFPIRNVPVIRVDIQHEKLSEEYVQTEIERSFERFDITEGSEVVALSFEDPVRAVYGKLRLFATSLASALPNSIKKKIPIILIFKRDIGNSVGNVIRRETAIDDFLISIDEIDVAEGDWIDIGSPLINGQVVPITVKSLIFERNNTH